MNKKYMMVVLLALGGIPMVKGMQYHQQTNPIATQYSQQQQNFPGYPSLEESQFMEHTNPIPSAPSGDLSYTTQQPSSSQKFFSLESASQPKLTSSTKAEVLEQTIFVKDTSPIDPFLLTTIFMWLDALWTKYTQSRRTANSEFNDEDWKVIKRSIQNLLNTMQSTGNKDLHLAGDALYKMVRDQNPRLLIRGAFGNILNNIIKVVNNIILANEGFYKQIPTIKQHNLLSGHKMLDVSTAAQFVPGLYKAKRAVVEQLAEEFRPAVSYISETTSGLVDWTKQTASDIRGGLSSAREYFVPDVKAAKEKLSIVRKEIADLERLQASAGLTEEEEVQLDTLKENADWLNSVSWGWTPYAITGATAFGLGLPAGAAAGLGFYLYSKLRGDSTEPTSSSAVKSAAENQ